MKGKRKQHTAAFKAQVALAAVKGDKTVNELASQYGVHPTLIHAWKKQLLAGADQVFSNGTKAATADAEAEKAELFEQIGRLVVQTGAAQSQQLALPADAQLRVPGLDQRPQLLSRRGRLFFSATPAPF